MACLTGIFEELEGIFRALECATSVPDAEETLGFNQLIEDIILIS